jgi:hypothetical protein
MKKAKGEVADQARWVSELRSDVGTDTTVPSHDCAECKAPLSRVSLDDLTPVEGEKTWIRRFVDGSSDLRPGRYRCSNCLSEWWQFPESVAS